MKGCEVYVNCQRDDFGNKAKGESDEDMADDIYIAHLYIQRMTKI